MKSFKLSDQGIEFVQNELKRYESRRSAILPCLYKVQEENDGWVSPDAVEYLSQIMDIPPSQIQEVLTFYTMFNTRPVGKHHIQVCGNISCSMFGGRKLAETLRQKLKVDKEKNISDDGKYSVSVVECLGACDIAPMAQIGNKYYGPLDEKKVLEILEGLGH